MPDTGKEELMEVVKEAVVAYLAFCASAAEVAGAQSNEVDAAVAAGADEVKETVDCSTVCELTYQRCIREPGADLDVCKAQKVACVGDC